MTLKELPKVGEKVRYLGGEDGFSCSGLTIGDTYDIKRISEYDSACFDTGANTSWVMTLNDLHMYELVTDSPKRTPQVGDKVRIIDCEECPDANGKVGTVTETEDRGFDVDIPSEEYGKFTYIDGYTDTFEYVDEAETDAINQPSHYTQGGVEVIDIIRQAVDGAEGFEAVCVANIVKYVMRYRYKNGVEDAKKAQKYLEWLIDYLDGECGERRVVG